MLNFDLALKSLKREENRGNNPVPDLLSFLHVKQLFGSKFAETMNDHYASILNSPQYISPLLKMDVPKSNFTIRPMARPHLKDWLLYEALVASISEDIFSNSDEVCTRSYSINQFKKHGNKSIEAWLEFDQKSRNLYDEGYQYVVVTDITAYFENINLDELRCYLYNFIDADKDDRVTALDNLLQKWSSERIRNYGLPQGPTASSFLGDFFLDHVDSKMEKYPGYFRFMDDIKIFCKDEVESKIALKDLIISLRDVKLNINAKKTSIWHALEIDTYLLDHHRELMNFIVETIKDGNKQLIKENVLSSLMMLFEKSFGDDHFGPRHLNFSLFRLGLLYNSNIEFDIDPIIDTILSQLKNKPHHTGVFCDFLTNFPNNSKIQNEILSFLQSEHNIYEWQEIKLLQCLIRFKTPFDKNQREILQRLCQDHNKHSIVTSFYLLLIGKHGSRRDRDMIIDSYDEKHDDFKKQAIILATQELGKAARDKFYNRLKRNDSKDIVNFIEYVKSLENPIYCLHSEKPRIEISEEISEYEPFLY